MDNEYSESNLKETGQTITKLVITYFSLCLLAVLISGFPDSYFLTTRQSVSLPFAGPTSFKTLLIALPLFLISTRGLIQIYLDHWRRLEELRVMNNIPVPGVISVLRNPILSKLIWIVAYPLGPVAIALMAYKSAVFYELAAGLSLICVCFCLLLLKVAIKISYTALGGILSLIFLSVAVFWFFGVNSIFHRSFDLRGADLERSVLNGIDFRTAKLTNANLRYAILDGSNFANANLWRADLSHATMDEASFEGARLGKVNFKDSYLFKSNMKNATLIHANLEGAVLDGTNFAHSNLSGANFKNANMPGISIDYAHMYDTNLEGAEIWEAVISDVDLRHVKGLTQSQLNSNNCVIRVLLPSNLHGKPC